MLTMKLILWGSIFWLPLFQLKPMLNEAAFKKNICIGVTLPYEAREDEEIKAAVAQYVKELKKIAWIIMALIIPLALIPGGFNVAMGIWGLWLFICIVGMQIPFVTANKKLRSIKEARGWKKQNAAVMVDTAVFAGEKWISPYVFIGLALVPLAGIIINKDALAVSVSMAATNLLLYVCYRYAYRNKAEMVDGNVEITKALTQIRRREWGKMFLLCAICMAVTGLAATVMIYQPVLATIVTIVICVVVCIGALRIEMNVRKLQEKLTENVGRDWYVDEDDHWLWGFLYYNPDDSHLVINNRTGAGSTINMAKPAGKIIAVFTVALLLWLPFMGYSMDIIINHEVTVEQTADYITAQSGKTKYEIPLSEVAQIQHLDELPTGLYKVYGTNTDKILKGIFSLEGIGSIDVCVNQDHGSFLLIQTKDGDYYLINAD